MAENDKKKEEITLRVLPNLSFKDDKEDGLEIKWKKAKREAAKRARRR